MQLGQIKVDGSTLAAVFEQGLARPIPHHTMLDLIRRAQLQDVPLPTLAAQLASRHAEPHSPVLPVNPPEVWACGCTYEASASFGDAEQGAGQGLYASACRQPRPEVYLKGTARVCVATGQAIGIRSDSQFTAPEPELAVVLGNRGRIMGYTLGNDVSAWDIELENPLYLAQSKIYDAACALGPVMLTADQLPDPYRLEMTCTIARGGTTLFSGAMNTSALRRKLDTLIEFLTRSNHVPSGTVLLTGTGIIVPREAALVPGDVVTIAVPEFGELVNPVALVG